MISTLESIFQRAKTDQDRYRSLSKLVKDSGILSANTLLKCTALEIPNATALICGDQKMPYAELYQRASAVSHWLVDRGIKPKDRVALLFENSIDFYIAYFGIWQTGAIVVPLNTFLHEKELLHILDEAQPAALVVMSDRAKALQGKVPCVMTEVDIKTLPGSRDSLFEPHEMGHEDLTVLLYTSGTTGKPKGVMLSSKNIMANVVQSISRLTFVQHERVFGVLPLFHSFAQFAAIWAPCFAGACVIIVPKIERRHILDALSHKPTFFLGVPALYGLLALLKTVPIDSVQYFMCGGDALLDKIRSAFALVYQRKMANGYGLTEASPVVAALLDDDIVPSNVVGKPLQGIECSIRGDKGRICKQGESGVLWVKGDNVMLGYYKAPRLTETVIKDGWLNTGDCAYIDMEGRIVITGREKDLIIHKGFNIYPQEIEQVLLGHANVLYAGVVGKKDEIGEVPVAFVQPKKAQSDLQDELTVLCKNNLASYKVPRMITLLDKIPLTALGKVDKKKLRE